MARYRAQVMKMYLTASSIVFKITFPVRSQTQVLKDRGFRFNGEKKVWELKRTRGNARKAMEVLHLNSEWRKSIRISDADLVLISQAAEGTCPCGQPATMGTGECLECRWSPFGSTWQREQEDARIFGH